MFPGNAGQYFPILISFLPGLMWCARNHKRPAGNDFRKLQEVFPHGPGKSKWIDNARSPPCSGERSSSG
jgi:hypothetical protein